MIMFDEGHEQTIHTNVLFGLLKGIVEWQLNLKLIITSTTLNAKEFFGYLLVLQLMYPSSPSLDKHSQRRFCIQATKQLETKLSQCYFHHNDANPSN